MDDFVFAKRTYICKLQKMSDKYVNLTEIIIVTITLSQCSETNTTFKTQLKFVSTLTTSN